MAKRTEESAGVYVQKGAKVLFGFALALIIILVILSIIVIPVYGLLVAAVLAVICVPLLKLTYSCLLGFGELVEDIHYIRNSNATVANFFDRADAARKAKENSEE